jgi:hypothetical protein
VTGGGEILNSAFHQVSDIARHTGTCIRQSFSITFFTQRIYTKEYLSIDVSARAAPLSGSITTTLISEPTTRRDSLLLHPLLRGRGLQYFFP